MLKIQAGITLDNSNKKIKLKLKLKHQCEPRFTATAILFVERIKGALSGLRQFLAAESPLKMTKNAFYFTSKARFVLKIFKFFVLTFWSGSKTA